MRRVNRRDFNLFDVEIFCRKIGSRLCLGIVFLFLLANWIFGENTAYPIDSLGMIYTAPGIQGVSGSSAVDDSVRASGGILRVSATVAARSLLPPEVQRFMRMPASIEQGKKEATTIINVNRGQWNYKECLDRIIRNSTDGDARFIVANYLLVANDLQKALFVTDENDTLEYKLFTRYDFKALRGSILAALAAQERSLLKIEAYYQYIKKEQSVYQSMLSSSKLDKGVQYDFNYLYAQTFADLGSFFEESIRNNIKTKPFAKVNAYDSIVVEDARTSYERSLSIVNSGCEPASRRVYELRAFIFDRIGEPEKAKNERILQGKMVRDSIFIQQRRNVTDQVAQGRLWSLFPDSVLPRNGAFYHKFLLSQRFLFEEDRIIDSLSENLFRALMVQLPKKFPKYMLVLSAENKDILSKELGVVVRNAIYDTIRIRETEQAFAELQTSIKQENTTRALFLMMKYGRLFDEIRTLPEIAECMDLLYALQDEAIQKEKELTARKVRLQTQKKEEEEVARVDATEKRNPAPVIQAPIQQKKKPADSASVLASAPAPLHVRINTLIDDLSNKKDYISAYRGIRAYEKMLKENYPLQQIDQRISGLETIIKREYGDKYLLSLKKEFQK